MQVAVLNKLEDGSFKPQKIEVDSKLDAKTMLGKTNNFLLCTKSCNGMYHPVYSELPSILSDHKKQSRNISKAVLKSLDFDEDVHGQRFVVFSNGAEAYLLGDVVTAIKKLSE